MILTVNDEDVGGTGRKARDVEEVDVVLRESHDGLVVASIGRLFDVYPGNRSGVGGNERAHIEEEQFIGSRDGVEDIRVVVKDGSEG